LNLDPETKAINRCGGDELGGAYAGKLVGFRPEDVEVASPGNGMVRGRVVDIFELPQKKKSVLAVELKNCEVQLYSKESFTEHEEIELKINRLHVFDPESGQLIE
jgi:hypothetical protein